MQIARTLAAKLRDLRGWRRAALASVLGAITASAHAPTYFLPAIFLLSVLPWLLAGATNKRAAFAIGWWFGFGMLTAGLYWISNALLVDSAKTAWLIPFTAAVLPSILAIFYGVATLATFLLRPAHGVPSALTLAIFWMLAEWLRGHLFTGFPWNLTGYIWGLSNTLLQSAAFIGIYGVSFLTILAALAFSALGRPPGNNAAHWRPAIITAVLLALIWVAGSVRLNVLQSPPTGPVVRVVQANIPQHQKWQNSYKAKHISQYLQMTAKPPAAGGPSPRAVIWPETAMALFLNESPDIRSAIGRVSPRNGFVLTGTVRTETTAAGGRKVWNSMFAIDDTGQVRDIFDKFHLVPFGEYVPFKKWISLPTVVESLSGFSAGPGPRTLELPGLPAFSPLICYEAIFPGQVRSKHGTPAALMINFTNDAWYGVSSGPYQHFVATQVRAIEEGVPLIRAAGTGISGIFDALGQEQARIGLNQTGFFDIAIPAALPNPTLYSQINDIPLFVCLIILLGWVVRHNWRGKTYTEG